MSEALGRHGCSDAISLVSGRDEVDDLLKVCTYKSSHLFTLSHSWKTTLT